MAPIRIVNPPIITLVIQGLSMGAFAFALAIAGNTFWQNSRSLTLALGVVETLILVSVAWFVYVIFRQRIYVFDRGALDRTVLWAGIAISRKRLAAQAVDVSIESGRGVFTGTTYALVVRLNSRRAEAMTVFDNRNDAQRLLNRIAEQLALPLGDTV